MPKSYLTIQREFIDQKHSVQLMDPVLGWRRGDQEV